MELEGDALARALRVVERRAAGEAERAPRLVESVPRGDLAEVAAPRRAGGGVAREGAPGPEDEGPPDAPGRRALPQLNCTGESR